MTVVACHAPRLEMGAVEKRGDFLLVACRTNRGRRFDGPGRRVDQASQGTAALHVRLTAHVARTARNGAMRARKVDAHILGGTAVMARKTSELAPPASSYAGATGEQNSHETETREETGFPRETTKTVLVESKGASPNQFDYSTQQHRPPFPTRDKSD